MAAHLCCTRTHAGTRRLTQANARTRACTCALTLASYAPSSVPCVMDAHVPLPVRLFVCSRIVLHCIASNFVALRCVALCCVVLFCVVFYCLHKVLPFDYDLKKSKLKFDGLFVSNGPGDPTMASATVDQLKWAIGQVTIGSDRVNACGWCGGCGGCGWVGGRMIYTLYCTCLLCSHRNVFTDC